MSLGNKHSGGMTQPTGSVSSDEKQRVNGAASEEQQYVLQVGWKALFRFTTKKHLPLFAGAMVSTAIAGATMPVFAIFYGRIFRDYTDYGVEKVGSHKLRSSVAGHCLILTGIAALNWITNSVFFLLFLTFGELQARSARNKIFNALIRKDMAWFDTRDTGIAAFLPAIQMSVIHGPVEVYVEALRRAGIFATYNCLYQLHLAKWLSVSFKAWAHSGSLSTTLGNSRVLSSAAFHSSISYRLYSHNDCRSEPTSRRTNCNGP